MLGYAPIGGIAVGGAPGGVSSVQPLIAKATIQCRGRFGTYTSGLTIRGKVTVQVKGRWGTGGSTAALAGRCVMMLKAKPGIRGAAALRGKTTVQVKGQGLLQKIFYMTAKVTIQTKALPKLIELGRPIIAFTSYWARRLR
jgi:hypothetical protein